MEYFNEVQPECDDKSNPNPPGSSKKVNDYCHFLGIIGQVHSFNFETRCTCLI